MTASPLAAPARPPGHFYGFLASLFLSRLADQVLLFLVPLAVFQATGSAAWSGLAFAAEALPRFLSFPVCGALCDRYSPLRLLHWSQALRAAACVLGAACGFIFGGVAWLVAGSAVCGVLTTQGVMAREVILPRAFKLQRFERVLATTQTADQLGAVLGPVVAAALLACTPWQVVMAAAGALFLLADGAMGFWVRATALTLEPPPPTEGGWRGWLGTMRTAFGHVIGIPGLRRLVVQAAGVNLVVGVTLASSAALFTGVHAQTAARFGVLQTSGAALTVVVLIGIARFAADARRLGAAGFAMLVAGGLLTALSPAPWGYAFGYLLVIGFDKMFNIYLRSSRQRIIPPGDYGKTTGVMSMLNNLSQPLAGLAVGAFAAQWSVQAVVLVLTLGMALLGVLSLLVSVPVVTAPEI